MGTMKKRSLLFIPLCSLLLASCDFNFSIFSRTPAAQSGDTPSSSVTPVYPTSISLPEEMSVGLSMKKVLRLTYSPSETTEKNVTYTSSDSAIASVDASGVVTGVALGQADITATVQGASGTLTATTKVTVKEQDPNEKRTLQYRYTDVTDHNYYPIDSAPTLGQTKLLIIPVWFTDSSTFISNKSTVRSNIETAYLGTAAETGWHSVKSYYETESQGRLTLNGTVSEWYECGKSYREYSPESASGEKTSGLVLSAVDAYFRKHTNEKRSDYDTDGDGYLDGVMLIYGAPDYSSFGKQDRPGEEQYSNLWAYCYWIQDKGAKNLASPGANSFFWASYDFMYSSGITARSKTGRSSYGGGDTSRCKLDAHTYIHEMGHIFGLDDYYDYGDNSYSIAAGFSMQDLNVGGHDPYSTMAFGWADPYIPNKSVSLTIGSFQKTHDLILLSPSWNEYDSPFDEYFLLELYTPTSLNAFDCTYSYRNKYPRGPSKTGIRLWHVDSRLVHIDEISRDRDGNEEPVLSLENLTANPDYATPHGIMQAFSNSINSDYSALDDNYNLLQLVRNNVRAPRYSADNITNADLFGDGASFSMDKYQSQFANGDKLNSGEALGWSFTVSIAGTGEDAMATIDLVRS